MSLTIQMQEHQNTRNWKRQDMLLDKNNPPKNTTKQEEVNSFVTER